MRDTGALPLHQRISELLIRDIAAGRLLDGERLPPEREMALRMGIAVGTLRRALSDLTAKGMLARVQGSGNYIRAKADPESVYALFRLELVAGGGLPTARVLSVDRLPKDPSLPEFGSSAEGHRIRRLRSLSGVAAAVEEIWLDGDCVATITPSDLSEALYLTYRRFGLWIVRTEDRVDQAPVPDWAPTEFPHAPGLPVPRVTRVAWARDGARAEVSQTWFDHQTVRYIARLK